MQHCMRVLSTQCTYVMQYAMDNAATIVQGVVFDIITYEGACL